MTDHDWAAAPQPDQVEIALFGPGKGECVLIHFGDGRWMVVDSCIDEGGRSAPLAYLESLGVPASSIELIVASHWHDDHVAGLAQVVRESTQARFVCSQALSSDEFVELVAAADLRPMVRTTSGVHEFRRVLDALDESNRVPSWAISDRLLVSSTGPPEVRMQALSPSDASVAEAHERIGHLLGMQANPNRLVVPRPERNPGAIVLHLKIDETVVLLCSDLEVDSDAAKGWSAVLDAPARPSDRAGWMKVAHHGSLNGHHARVWDEMLTSEPHAALTPYLSGRTPLPRATDVARLVALTPNVFITRRPGSPRATRDWRAQRMAERVVNWISAVPASAGAARFRRAVDGSDEWATHLSGSAVQLTA